MYFFCSYVYIVQIVKISPHIIYQSRTLSNFSQKNNQLKGDPLKFDPRLNFFGHGLEKCQASPMVRVRGSKTLYMYFRHGVRQPAYINMVRDPAKRVLSHFYFSQRFETNVSKLEVCS